MRLFIAATFPSDVISDVNQRIDKQRLPAASWVKPESQHLTFAFLGEQPEVPEISLRIPPAFEARLAGGGFFPNRHHARVGWVGVEPREKFIELADRIREGLKGVSFDEKEFKPHLTLMRIRDRWPPRSIEMFERALRDYRSAPFTVSSVTLYSSELHPSGAVHTPLRVYAQ